MARTHIYKRDEYHIYSVKNITPKHVQYHLVND